MIAPGVRLVAALRFGAVLVARPRGVVHVHDGRLTPNGSVPASVRPFCGTRSRRLRVVGTVDAMPNLIGGRRFCRSCTRRLPAALGRRVSEPGPRDEWLATYDGLTVEDLTVAARWTRTVDETYQVDRLALMLHGPKPLRPATAEQCALRDLHDLIEKRRRDLTRAAQTPEERAEAEARREAADHDRRRLAAARSKDAAVARAVERRERGQYLMPHERELLGT